MEVIRIEHLSKSYGTCKAVDDISFSIKKGAFIGFLGVNGAGKSTTINMLSTLLKPTSGSITVCGMDASADSAGIRRKLGIVFQNNVLDELLTVRENLLCRGILHGADKISARLEELTEVFTLGDIMKQQYRTLSGGQKRRCEIAAALMHTPEILILDEPTTGLDPAARQEVWETIGMLRKHTDMTVFLTTHYMEEAADADRILILSKGKLIADGTPHVLKERYASDYLKIYCTSAAKQTILPVLSCPYTEEPYGLCIRLATTREAIAILNRIGNSFDGFEVIRGTMDDVFLNATKERR